MEITFAIVIWKFCNDFETVPYQGNSWGAMPGFLGMKWIVFYWTLFSNIILRVQLCRGKAYAWFGLWHSQDFYKLERKHDVPNMNFAFEVSWNHSYK